MTGIYRQVVIGMTACMCFTATGGDAHGAVPRKPANTPRALVDLKTEKRIQSIVASMTLAEKVGQMTQVELKSINPAEITTFMIGSILSGGGSVPPDARPQGWIEMYETLQRAAGATRLKIPLIYGVDAVHGHNNVPGATIFPHNIGMGATRDPGLYEESCRIAALEVAATGLNWTFSPCITVPRDERWGRTYEGFGETAALQTMFAGPGVRGYQKQLTSGRRVAACAKHYVGDGGTAWGSGVKKRKLLDQGDTRIDEETLRSLHLPGYRSAVDAGVLTVMASFSAWNGDRMHGHHYLITEVLKKELGFTGMVVSDWEGIEDLKPDDLPGAVKAAINAGIDLAMEPMKWRQYIAVLTSLVEKGEVPMERINDAVTRILRVKFACGLFDNPMADRSLTDTVGCAAHRRVARSAVAASCVVLKNDRTVLPLSPKGKTIVVAGTHADDVGLQCGGWTLSWQGGSGEVPGGTSVLAGIRQVAPKDSIIWVQDTTVIADADVAVIVVGEPAYAEFDGDRLAGELVLDSQSCSLIAAYHKAGVPVVTVLISGRPLAVTPQIKQSSAFIAAWLPGSEGAGVADVLFGKVKPTGKLPHSWPADTAQIPVNEGDGRKPLFEIGYGLSF